MALAPLDMTPAPLHETKVTVWCDMTNTFCLVLPYFFEEVTSTGMKTYSITSSRSKNNVAELHNFTIAAAKCHYWHCMTQDGAPAHVASCVRQVLQQHSFQTSRDNTVISRNFAFSCPPRSSRPYSARFLVLRLSGI